MAKINRKLRFMLTPHGENHVVDTKLVALGREYASDSKRVIKELIAAMEAEEDFIIGDEDGGIRVYMIVGSDTEKIKVCAQTFGWLRTIMGDATWTIADESKLTWEDAKRCVVADKRRKAKERGMICVTPDSIVTCPKCKTQFRVGKALADCK